MKMLRKNIDLDSDTVAVLMIESTLNGFGTLKPFMEKIIADYATKAKKGKPEIYKKILVQKEKRMKEKITQRKRIRSLK